MTMRNAFAELALDATVAEVRDKLPTLTGTGSVPVETTDSRGLTERMFAKAPASGYALWLDTADATYIYLAEAPSADGGAANTFRGIRVTKDASGNPLGKVQIATDFAWNSRASAGWV